MKHVASVLVLLGLFTALPARAVQSSWVKMNALMSYRDFRIACSSLGYPNNLYLRLDTENGRLVGAVMKVTETPLPEAEHISFGDEEINGLSFQRDAANNLWLHTMTLSPRLIVWVVDHAGFSLCHPSYPMATIAPGVGTFLFAAPTPNPMGGLRSISSEVTFNGQIRNRDPYTLDLYFQQLDRKPAH